MPLSLTDAQHRSGQKLIACLCRSPRNTVALRSEVATMTLRVVRLHPSIPVPLSACTPGTQAIAPFSAHTTNAAHSLFILPALRLLPCPLLIFATLSPPLSVLVLPALRPPPRSLLILPALRPLLHSLPMLPLSLLVLPAPKLPPLSSEFQVLMTLRQVPLKLKQASGPVSTVPHSKET